MSITAFTFQKGTPLDARGGRFDAPENYEFCAISLSQAQEEAILKEASCWELVRTKEEIYDYEDYGKEITPLGVDATPLSLCEGDYILFHGQLVGFRYDGTLFFLPKGNSAGSRFRFYSVQEGGSSDTYVRHTLSIRKAVPSAQAVYYAPTENNPYETAYGIDPLAEHAVLAHGTRVIYNDIFADCINLRTVSLPASLERIEPSNRVSFVGSDNLTSITVDPANPIFHAEGNCLIQTAQKSLICGTLSCTIPTNGSVTSIAPFAFYRARLAHLTVPEGVESIGEYAFGQSLLESITLPKTLVSIAGNAFSYCRCLSRIYYHGDEDAWNVNLRSYFRNFQNLSVFFYSEQRPEKEGNFWRYSADGEIANWK